MARAKIGDILEIPTSQGIAYAQYTHQHEQFGGVIRVFDSVFQRRPDDFTLVVNSAVRFTTFFPVRAAVQKGIFKVVANHEIAVPNQPFPIFRDGFPDPKTKRVAEWWFWDGEKEWKVGRLTPEQMRLPLRTIWNDTLLVQRIEGGWRPETDYR